ncbi:MAG: alpha-amylase family glycosyl hydrolase [Acidimicrobiales bacterium]
MTTPPAVPRATYRIGLREGVTFATVASMAEYLSDLGVSHLYLSPPFAAAPGSTHGYDVADPARLDPVLGGIEGWDAMVMATQACGLGLVLDIVPNHMSTHHDNLWWWDVLKNGPASPWARFFDIDWSNDLCDDLTVLVPILEDHYGREIEAGSLTVVRHDNEIVVRYGPHVLPLCPHSYPWVMGRAANLLSGAPADHLDGLARHYGDLPRPSLTDSPEVVARGMALRESLSSRLDEILAREDVASAVDTACLELSREVEELDQVLREQNYRLAWWRTAADQIDYRRFFTIESLVGLRVEDQEVFDSSHWLALALVHRGDVAGLRVDHLDGLADPDGYLTRLAEAAPGAWLVVEKILAPPAAPGIPGATGGDDRGSVRSGVNGEELPGAWPVAGSTGYDFLRSTAELYTDTRGEEAMDRCFRSFTDEARPWPEVARQARRHVLCTDLGAELARLTRLASSICDRNRRHRDHSRLTLTETLVELLSALGVYRVYEASGAEGPPIGDPASSPGGHASPEMAGGDMAGGDMAGGAMAGGDMAGGGMARRDVARAEADVIRRRPDLDAELVGFLAGCALAPVAGGEAEELARRMAQVCGPVMAKGVEDRAFYQFPRLLSLNEVGCDPGRFGGCVEDFHRAMTRRAERNPASMLTLSTHDTKRSSDVRARIALLAEATREWAKFLTDLDSVVDAHRRRRWSDPVAEYTIHQTLVGTWPIEADRLAAVALKSAREAGQRTSWAEPDPAYEGGLNAFARGVATDVRVGKLLRVLLEDVGLLSAARVTSLAQTTLLLTCPGVPDIYQGGEVIDERLVDPDNRRPVDFAGLAGLLAGLDSQTYSAGTGTSTDGSDPDPGALKLRLIQGILRFRRDHPGPFTQSYNSLEVEGRGADHTVAFSRGQDLAVVVPRLVLAGRRDGSGSDAAVRLGPGSWCDVLTGRVHRSGLVPVAALWSDLPVAVLRRD